ncbi:MAG: peptidoglycan DD-metalloendopeptidase family protein [Patescibacteria group bacterium]
MLSIIATFAPVLVLAKGQAGALTLVPDAYETGNSQTMDLLEGYLNSNPANVGGPVLAIVDDTALSSDSEAAGAFAETGQYGTGQISTYIVREGDTMGGIAQMFGVSVNTIMWSNDLKSKTLKIGQELVILPITGVKHVVKSGDTLASISKKYQAELDDILSYNSIPAGSKLIVGDTIIVPGGSLNGTQVVTNNSNNQTVNSGYYIRPINSGRKSQGIHGYNAVDLAASVGTPIMASADGTVVIARTSGYNGGYGLYVAIKHANGTQTVYGHMSKVNVVVGQRVEQGEVIGAVGNTGRSTGTHVHFEIRGARNPF